MMNINSPTSKQDYQEARKLLLQCFLVIIVLRSLRAISLYQMQGASNAFLSTALLIDILYFAILCLFIYKGYPLALYILLIEAIYALLMSFILFSELPNFLLFMFHSSVLFFFVFLCFYIRFSKRIRPYFTHKKYLRFQKKTKSL
ncbi:MAG: hypothetical protein ACK5KR_01055 [Breznakia sp.]